MRSSIAFALLALFASSVSAQAGASQRARRSYESNYDIERRQATGPSQRARRSYADEDDHQLVGRASQRARRAITLSGEAPTPLRCPASHSKCILAGSLRGIECVDTSVRSALPPCRSHC